MHQAIMIDSRQPYVEFVVSHYFQNEIIFLVSISLISIFILYHLLRCFIRRISTAMRSMKKTADN